MRLVLAKSLLRREFGNRYADKDLVPMVAAFGKGIYREIGGFGIWPGHKLLKVYSTTDRGARRSVFMADASMGDAFFLFYRDKNDSVGKNIALQNPEFKKQLGKHLALLAADIENGNLDVREFGK